MDSDHLDATLGKCELCLFSLAKENGNLDDYTPQYFSERLGDVSWTFR